MSALATQQHTDELKLPNVTGKTHFSFSNYKVCKYLLTYLEHIFKLFLFT